MSEAFCGPPQSGGECTSCGRPDDRAHADRSCCAGIGHQPLRALGFSGTGLFGHWAFRALTFRGPPAGAGARKPPGKFGAAGGAQGGATGQSKGLQYSIFVYGRNGFAHLAVAFATLCLISGVTLVPVSNPTASTHTSARATSGVGSWPSAPRAVRRRPPRATRGRAR